jgi:hypothetical protein
MLFFTLLPPSTQEKQAIAAHAKQKVGTHTLVHDGGAWSCPISTSKALGNACQIAPVAQPPSLYGWNASAPSLQAVLKHFHP